MISYVEAMIKNSEVFVHVVTYDAYKPGHVEMSGHGECRGMALGKGGLCRVPRIRHSAKRVLNFF